MTGCQVDVAGSIHVSMFPDASALERGQVSVKMKKAA